MITFLTLFLGLTSGLQPVQVETGPPVARVELRLDGAAVAELTGPRWRGRIDFGDELWPRRLEAVAFDAAGDELGRALQTVNLAARQAEATLALERDATGRPTAVRLAWQSAEFPQPSHLALRLDGEPLPVADPRRVPLPELAADRVHFVTADLAFADAATAHADLAFGGAAGRSLNSRNTALPVELAGRGGLPDATAASGLLLAAGEPARVVAVERGGIDLVVVPERSVEAELAGLRPEIERAIDYEPRWLSAGLDAGDRLFLVSSLPAKVKGGGRGLLFRAAPGRPASAGGLAWQLTHVRFPPATAAQRLADAVAMGGLLASGGTRPRAVLLLVGPEPADAGGYPPAEVRRFLQRLRVPLYVWRLERGLDALSPRERRSAARRAAARETARRRMAADWGPMLELGSAPALVDAALALRAELGRQRLIWVEGGYLPTELTVAPDREGVRLAGATATAPPRLPPRPAAPPDAVAGGAEPTAGGTGAAPRAAAAEALPPAEAADGAAGGAAEAPLPATAGVAAPEELPQQVPSQELAEKAPEEVPEELVFGEAVAVEVVSVDVHVTDRTGRRVAGLEAADFEVYEDGQRVELTHFAAVGEAAGGGRATGEPPPAAGVPGRRRAERLVLYFDDVSLDPPARARALRDLRPFVAARLAAGAEVMVTTWDGSLHRRQPFTTDREAVSRTLDEIERLTAAGSRRAYDLTVELRRALDALAATVDSLTGVAGRKALVYVSGGIPFVPAGDLTQQYLRLFSDAERRNTAVPAYFARDTAARFAEIAANAAAGEVTFYTLDAGGLRAPTSMGPETGEYDVTIGSDSLRARALVQPLANLAEDTGGLALSGGNRFADGLERVSGDLDAHYSLGYRPPAGSAAGEHEIEVMVKRPGLRLRHRPSYRRRDAGERLAAAAVSALYYPPADNPLAAELLVEDAATPAAAGGRRLAVRLRLPVARLTLIAGGGGERRGRLELALAARDAAGDRSPVAHSAVDVRLPAAASGAPAPELYTVTAELSVGEGPQTVAVGVRDALGGTVSVVTADAGAPD